jgi:hypothetical protein
MPGEGFQTKGDHLLATCFVYQKEKGGVHMSDLELMAEINFLMIFEFSVKWKGSCSLLIAFQLCYLPFCCYLFLEKKVTLTINWA